MSTNKHGLKKIQNETAKTESILSPFICNYIDPDRFYISIPRYKKGYNQSMSPLSWVPPKNDRLPGRNNGEEPLDKFMFSGMPTTMISTYYKGNYLENIYEFLFVGPRPAADLILGFISLLSYAGIWSQSLVVHCWCLAFGLCSYNFQIIQVGHNAKMTAISPLCLLFAALVYAFRKNDGWEPCCLASRSLSRLWPITHKSHSIWHLLRYSTV